MDRLILTFAEASALASAVEDRAKWLDDLASRIEAQGRTAGVASLRSEAELLHSAWQKVRDAVCCTECNGPAELDCSDWGGSDRLCRVCAESALAFGHRHAHDDPEDCVAECTSLATGETVKLTC